MKSVKKYLTIYSGVAILFVLLIHSNAYYLHYVNENEDIILMKVFINIINIAVPMFIFIAGYKYQLTNKSRDLKEYYKIKFNRIIKPTLIISILWSCIFLALSIIKKALQGQAIDIVFYLKTFLYRIFQIFIGNNDIYQLWYIPMYIFIVFLYPNIEKYNVYNKIIIFSILAIVQVVGSCYFSILNEHPFDFIYYFIFFEMGVLFYKNENKLKFKKSYYYNIFIVLILISGIFTNENINKILIKLIIYPIGVIVFYYISQLIQNISWIEIIGRYSFIIYVLHEPIILSRLGILIQILNLYNSWIWVPIISIIGIILCIFLYKISLRFKIGRYFWGEV
ncbi:MAG: acyltransferase family protein [Clostridium sp.]|uniref:acyltransferase family protein n=1 Tax=Clostridium sp. TaxID=1506 RepID=UPI00399B5426